MKRNALKLKIKELLENPLDYEWEIQGFGMLRTYIDKDTRVQIWHNDYKVPNVTDIHTHPWNFTSKIIQGVMRNICFVETEHNDKSSRGTYNRCLILTGENAYVKEKTKVNLTKQTPSIYIKGTKYKHRKDVPHRTDYVNGTITVLTKKAINEDSLAYSYTPGDSDWVSAAPRIATKGEILFFVNSALELSKKEKSLEIKEPKKSNKFIPLDRESIVSYMENMVNGTHKNCSGNHYRDTDIAINCIMDMVEEKYADYEELLKIKKKYKKLKKLVNI